METDTVTLLTGWHAGDETALEHLLRRHLDWLRAHVSRRLGKGLRRKAETVDFVQDAVVQVLRYAPKFRVNDEDHFRGLLGRIIENSLRDQHDWYRAQRRDMAQERPLPSTTVLELTGTHETPSGIADRHEREAWVRLGLELLDPGDREVIVLREWKGLAHAEIGARLGVSAAAAHQRYSRAVRRLGKVVRALRRGDLPLPSDPAEAIDDAEPAPVQHSDARS